MDITVVSTIDRNYWAPFEVAAASVLRAKHPGTAIEWHVFTDEETGDWCGWRDGLQRRYGGAGVVFAVHQVGELSRLRVPLWGGARPIMYARLLVPAQLPVTRMIYLDADIVVAAPIEELWAAELGTSVCGACQDLAIPTVSSTMGLIDYRAHALAPETPYANAGVLVIDGARWREQSVGERALAYLSGCRERVNLLDQGALNAVLAGTWAKLSLRWNLIASVAGRSFLDLRYLPREDYQASLRAPGIVHFAGMFKPWLNPCLKGRWFDLYRAAWACALPRQSIEPKLRHWLEAAYDRWARDRLYPVEHALWQARRGW